MVSLKAAPISASRCQMVLTVTFHKGNNFLFDSKAQRSSKQMNTLNKYAKAVIYYIILLVLLI